MVFRRKRPATLVEKIRAAVWPRKGFSRGLRYLCLRILRLSSSPHAIALGVAAGAASSSTPFVGLHILLALALAYGLSGNLLSAGLSTALANPFTIPFILAADYEIGIFLVGGQSGLSGEKILHMLRHLELANLWGPVLKPMLIGCLPLSLGSALLFYGLSFFAARAFQSRRKNRSPAGPS